MLFTSGQSYVTDSKIISFQNNLLYIANSYITQNSFVLNEMGELPNQHSDKIVKWMRENKELSDFLRLLVLFRFYKIIISLSNYEINVAKAKKKGKINSFLFFTAMWSLFKKNFIQKLTEIYPLFGV